MQMKKESLEEFLKRGGEVKSIKTGHGVSKKIKKKQKLKNKIKSKRKKAFIKQRSKELEENLPKSEVWFRTMYAAHKAMSNLDRFNKPFRKYIPDVINMRFRYIIEIDGSIHLDEEVIKNDKIRDKYFTDRQFEVIRVKAYDIDSYIQAIETIMKIRKWTLPEEFIKFKLAYQNNK